MTVRICALRCAHEESRERHVSCERSRRAREHELARLKEHRARVLECLREAIVREKAQVHLAKVSKLALEICFERSHFAIETDVTRDEPRRIERRAHQKTPMRNI